LVNVKGGDDRFYNNLFVGQGESAAGPDKGSGFGLSVYDARELPLKTGGNVYVNGARPYAGESNALLLVAKLARPAIVEAGGRMVLHLQLDSELKNAATVLVTSELLGKARIPDLPYVNPDATRLVVDVDYFGRPRDAAKPRPGPFESDDVGKVALKVW